MNIDRTSGRPPARQIADSLAAQILSGELPAGIKLPSTAELAARYGVSSRTVGQAMAYLKGYGLAIGRVGRGVYVRPRGVVRRDLLAGLHLEHERAMSGGPDIGLFEQITRTDTAVSVDYATVAADAQIAAALATARGTEMLCRTYRYTVGSDPYQIARSYLPLNLVRDTPLMEPANEQVGRGTIAQLREIGVTVSRASLELEARMPLPAEVSELAAPPGTPVFIYLRTLYANDRPVEASRAIVRADLTAYTLTVDFDADQ